SSVATSTGCAHVGQDADAFGLEGRLHLTAGERLLAAEETWSPFEDGDLLAAQPAERLGELDARGPSAEDEEPPRHIVGSCRVAVVPRHDVREADQCLTGDAPPVRALAADELFLDERDRETAAGTAADGVLAGRPAADHDHVKGVAQTAPSCAGLADVVNGRACRSGGRRAT